MNILDKIIAQKKVEVALDKSQRSVKVFEKSPYFNAKTYDFRQFIKEKSGVIAEFKRKSPSKGIINDKATVEEVTKGYTEAGASALSILTDTDFFGGHFDDVLRARAINAIPILRKEFIIDEYQIIEAKSIGADVILLIAECLDKQQVASLAKVAKSLGMYVLMEIHTEDQLAKMCYDLDAIGVNNRNLKTFDVNIRYSLDILPNIPNEFLKISESGLSDPNTVKELRTAGFDGFLIGENFMKTENPGEAAKEFIRSSGFNPNK